MCPPATGSVERAQTGTSAMADNFTSADSSQSVSTGANAEVIVKDGKTSLSQMPGNKIPLEVITTIQKTITFWFKFQIWILSMTVHNN